MNSIGVVGQGFVGTAVFEGMRHAFHVWSYDKAKGWSNSSSYNLQGPEDNYQEQLTWLVHQTDGPIFVCVPTPMNPDGSCNTSVVESVILGLNQAAERINKSGQVVVIKSTVVPGTTSALNDKCEHLKVAFNPEFLTEANYINDFKNQDRIILGADDSEALDLLESVYSKAYPDVPVHKVGSTEAEFVKYTTNCFLATKVSFANELSQICESSGADYKRVIELATLDKRLGNSHWSVPGPMPADDGTGRLLKGFAGSCFVKDLNAFIHLAKDHGVDPKVMEAAWNKNLEVRPEKDWEKLKGRAVI